MEQIPWKTRLLRAISSLTGYEIFKKAHSPVGYDFFSDLKNRVCLPVALVFDVGANEGQTVDEVRKAYPEARIHCFEPVASTFNRLSANTKNLRGIFINHTALGSEIGSQEIRLYRDDESVANSLRPEAQNKTADAVVETIQITTGDSYCQQHGISKIDLLKIDTEGYELQVLQGFERMLDEGGISAVFCEVCFSPSDEAHTFINDLNNFMLGKGYVFYAVYNISNAAIKVGRSFCNVLYLSPNTLQNTKV